MRDDELAIRSAVQKLVEEEEKTVVLVAHSAGGFLGAGAIEGLGLKDRVGRGKRGGVERIVFLCAGLAPEGYVHERLPFMDFDVRISIPFHFRLKHEVEILWLLGQN